jgi:DNA-binding protein YbaB
MGLFGQAKDLYQLQKKAKLIKEKLKNLHIEAEVEGVKVVINAEQEVQEVIVSEELLKPENKEKLDAKLAQEREKLAEINKMVDGMSSEYREEPFVYTPCVCVVRMF